MNLKGKVSIITGGGSGIGRATAIALANKGSKVCIVGRTPSKLIDVLAEVKLNKGEGITIEADVTNYRSIENVVNKVNEEWGRIDILVTNTGGPPTGQFEEFDLNDWEKVFNHLFLSATDIIKRVLPSMKKNGYGRILTITSMAVKQPIETLITSNAIRTGLVGFVKSLSNEVASSGITVNNIMPGWTMTDRLKQLISDNPDFEKAIDSIPMKRFGTPEEFASAAIFLVSDKASYITGVSLPVDGGWIKGL